MNLATLTVLGGLALGAFAAPSSETQETNPSITNPVVVAWEVPGTEYRGTTPSPLPLDTSERVESPTLDSSRPTWEDTADTSDELYEPFLREVQIDDPLNPDAELDVHLRNAPDDALFEDTQIDSVIIEPALENGTEF